MIILSSRIPSVLDLVPSVDQAITVPNHLEKPAYDNSEHSPGYVSILQVACDKLAQGLHLVRTNCPPTVGRLAAAKRCFRGGGAENRVYMRRVTSQ